MLIKKLMQNYTTVMKTNQLNKENNLLQSRLHSVAKHMSVLLANYHHKHTDKTGQYS